MYTQNGTQYIISLCWMYLQSAVIVRLLVPATTSSAVINVTRASSNQTAQKVCFVTITPIMHVHFKYWK